jgi:crotonobetainyl-CoA:carnitine CoA-transferase CaiB-like acyl-CoA transferase
MSTAGWRQQRGLTRVVDHPYIGKQEVVVPPWRFGNQSAGVERPAPLLGADTDDVLAALKA